MGFCAGELAGLGQRQHVGAGTAQCQWQVTPGALADTVIHTPCSRYIVYYAARDLRGQTVVGAAVSETGDPFGRYLDIGRPLVSSRESMGGVIDPHYFKDPPTGRSYLLWKEDKPLALQTSIIMIRELHPSGLHFIGKPVEILASSLGNLLEERLVAEAPWLMYRGGNYYLFYSSAWFSEMKYHIRVAVSKSVFGPFYRLVNSWDKMDYFIFIFDMLFSRSHTPVITTDWGTLHQVRQVSVIILSLSIHFSRHQPYLFLFFFELMKSEIANNATPSQTIFVLSCQN